MKILCDCGEEICVGDVAELTYGIHVIVSRVTEHLITMLRIECKCGRVPICVDVGPPANGVEAVVEPKIQIAKEGE